MEGQAGSNAAQPGVSQQGAGSGREPAASSNQPSPSSEQQEDSGGAPPAEEAAAAGDRDEPGPAAELDLGTGPSASPPEAQGPPELGADCEGGGGNPAPQQQGEQRKPPSYAVRHLQPGPSDDDGGEAGPAADGTQQELPGGPGFTPEALAQSPQLAQVQEALRRQLQASKLRVEEELRARRNTLKAAVREREDVGVELFGFQQTLARLQLGLQRSQEAAAREVQERQAADAALRGLQQRAEAEEKLTAEKRLQMESFRTDLERLSATLRQVDAYNEQLKSDIATTRRATYAAEEGVQKRERAKRAQDLLVDDLYRQVRRQEEALALHSGRLAAQREQSEYARATLATAVGELDAVRAEQRKRSAQWQAALGTLQKRDDALREAEAAHTAAAEEEALLIAASKALRKEIAEAGAAAEAAGGVCKRVEGRGALLQAATAKLQGRAAALQARVGEARGALAAREAALGAAQEAQRQLAEGRAAVDRDWARAAQALQAQEARLLDELAEQTQAERSAQRAVVETVRMRAQVKEGGLTNIALQNELARIEMDVFGTEAHSAQLGGAVAGVDAEIMERLGAVGDMEAQMARQESELTRKARHMAALDRKYEKIMAALAPGEHAGPLEATIANLTREIKARGEEGHNMQRVWVHRQTALIALTQANSREGEALGVLRSTLAVLSAQRDRLEARHGATAQEVHEQERRVGQQRAELGRLNGALADSRRATAELESGAVNARAAIASELTDQQEEIARLRASLEEGRAAKAQLLEQMLEAEAQAAEVERTIQVKREMQEALDPSVGRDAADALRKEIHRMRLRCDELQAEQQRTLAELERAVEKRDSIALKGRAAQQRAAPAVTEQTQQAALGDLQRSLGATRQHTLMLQGKAQGLQAQQAEATEGVAAAQARCAAHAERLEALRGATEEAAERLHKALLRTVAAQKGVRRYEAAAASGKLPGGASSAESVGRDLAQAQERVEQLAALVGRCREGLPGLEAPLARVLCRTAAVL